MHRSVIESEHARHTEARSIRRLKEASLLMSASIDQVDFALPRGLSRAYFLELAQGGWLASAHHLLITGPTGVGKTFVGSALASHICQRGHSVRYQRVMSGSPT
jgi:DNA replication protein DnaC